MCFSCRTFAMRKYRKANRVNDVSGLNAAVGSGNVTVTFELQ